MCHVPEQAFVNQELRNAVGVYGRSVKRNAPILINVGFLDVLFHDGRDTSLETQFVGPLVAHNEMANPSVGVVIALLNDLPEYQSLFDAAFQAPASLDRTGMALAAYQRSLVAGGSDFDRWYYGGEAGCASCHLIGPEDALFTDQQFHDTGYGCMREQARQTRPETTRVEVAPGVIYDVNYDLVAAVSAPREADLGRYEVTEDPTDRWKSARLPLRNLALTAPYMHDGAMAELRKVLMFYNDGGPGHPLQDDRIRPLGLGLNDQDLDDLGAPLRSLTSPALDCLAAEARTLRPDNH